MTNKLTDELNRIAMIKFQNLRSTMKLDFTNLALKKADIPLSDEETILGMKNVHQLTNEDFNELLTIPAIDLETKYKITDELVYVDKIMDFITSLKLPSAQSLAIGLIISGTKKNDRSELRKAANILLNGVKDDG